MKITLAISLLLVYKCFGQEATQGATEATQGATLTPFKRILDEESLSFSTPFPQISSRNFQEPSVMPLRTMFPPSVYSMDHDYFDDRRFSALTTVPRTMYTGYQRLPHRSGVVRSTTGFRSMYDYDDDHDFPSYNQGLNRVLGFTYNPRAATGRRTTIGAPRRSMVSPVRSARSMTRRMGTRWYGDDDDLDDYYKQLRASYYSPASVRGNLASDRGRSILSSYNYYDDDDDDYRRRYPTMRRSATTRRDVIPGGIPVRRYLDDDDYDEHYSSRYPPYVQSVRSRYDRPSISGKPGEYLGYRNDDYNDDDYFIRRGMRRSSVSPSVYSRYYNRDYDDDNDNYKYLYPRRFTRTQRAGDRTSTTPSYLGPYNQRYFDDDDDDYKYLSPSRFPATSRAGSTAGMRGRVTSLRYYDDDDDYKYMSANRYPRGQRMVSRAGSSARAYQGIYNNRLYDDDDDYKFVRSAHGGTRGTLGRRSMNYYDDDDDYVSGAKYRGPDGMVSMGGRGSAATKHSSNKATKAAAKAKAVYDDDNDYYKQLRETRTKQEEEYKKLLDNYNKEQAKRVDYRKEQAELKRDQDIKYKEEQAKRVDEILKRNQEQDKVNREARERRMSSSFRSINDDFDPLDLSFAFRSKARRVTSSSTF